MKDFRGTRILLMANKLFGIEANIQKELEDRGAIVDYFDERPGNSFMVKALIRINRNLLSHHINKYHSEIIESIKNRKYDYILFIKGESFAYHNLKRLLSTHPEATSIIYHWDSVQNNNNALKLLPLFDRKFSFDRSDCHNYAMTFLPLFYYNDYSKVSNCPAEFKYDLMFVGTAHSDRYKIIRDVVRQFEEKGKKCFTFFFFQGKIMFYKYLLQHKDARNINSSEIHFDSIDKGELLNIYNKSKIIIDVAHPKQRGLTLRCIEALGARRKLITTNEDIKNYDFYNPDNIYVIDRCNPIVDDRFINSEYIPLSEDVYKKYSLSNWIDTVFSHSKQR